MTQAPWWTFPRIDNFGMIDPAGPYWKPDTNVQVPGYYPIAAILPGTVTSVQQTGWGQTVVTVKLDNALNSLATHTFYEHMSSANVQVGQRVTQGTLIGYNNPSGAVPLGFGLYSGDVYGSGSAWTALQNDLKPGGAGLLNPVSLINQVKAGKTPTTGSTTNASTGNPLLDSVLPNVKQWAEYAAIFILAILLIIIGFVLLGGGDTLVQAGKAVIAHG